MNKKFSTLVAGALLAGAVITPTDLLAQIMYAGGKTYADVVTTPTAPTTGTNQDYFIVFTDGGKDYVATVKANGSLEAKAFENAQMTDVINVAFATPDYTITGGGNTLGFATGQLGFGSDITDMTTVTLADGAIVISDGTGYAKLTGTAFSVDHTSNTITAKAVAKTSLIAVPTMPSNVSVATNLKAGSYLLVNPTNGEIYKGAADGTVTSVSYATPYTQDMFWAVEISNVNVSTGVARFKNVSTGKYLLATAGATEVATAAVIKSGNDWVFATYESITVTDGGSVTTIALGAVPADGKTLEAGDLVAITGAGFEASIKKYVDGDKKDKALANNPFVDVLKPVKFVLSAGKPTAKVEAAAANDDAYMLQDADGNIIVVDLDDKYAAGTGTKYAVKTISPAALANALNSTTQKVYDKYAYNFTIKAADDFVVGVNQVVNSITVTNKANSTYKLGSVDLSAVPTLAAESTGESFLNAITIKVGKFNKIDVAKLLTKTPSFFTVTNKNTKAAYSSNYGKVLGLDADGDAAFVKASEALVGYPETQWAVTYTGGNLVFTNRENPTGTVHTISVADLYNTAKANVFANIDGDTLEIKPVAKFTEADGFLRLNADDLRDQQYYVGAYSSIFDGVAYWVENHKDNHQVGMDTKKDVATAWNVRTYTYNGTDNLGTVVVSRPDTLLIGSTLGYYDADGNYKTTDDNGDKTVFLKTLAYSFQNNANKEYFAYDVNRYATGEAGKKEGFKDEDEADYFAVKMAGDDIYNLVAVDITSGQENLALDAEKIYSGDGANKGILNQIGKYSQTENDLFVVEKKDAPEYRKVAMADTVKIYRQGSVNEAQVLFEKGEFLSIENAVQFPTINPALYVDTAYVDRGNNNRWEYLLAVEAKHWKTTEECNDPSHPKHVADTTSGRFLVNLMDSAYVYAETHLHDNKFINEEDGESFAKLGFVNGYHTHDTLYLERPNGTYAELPLNRVDYSHSIVKYAFRYVDQEVGSFVIETGIKDYNGGEAVEGVATGYLKWLNGVVVVVPSIEQADVFNMNEDETRIPTANEGVNAAEVSVIASEGSVIINGAQGKKVVITNVLGQTVANTVISSDKAEIAAPAGVVVVAVEGEAAVKAIVK